MLDAMILRSVTIDRGLTSTPLGSSEGKRVSVASAESTRSVTNKSQSDLVTSVTAKRKSQSTF